MNIIINGVKTDKGPLTTSDVKIFINGKEEKGILKITFDADASRGDSLTVVTMMLVPDSLYIKGDFTIKEKKIDGLNIRCNSKSLWFSREAIENILNGKVDAIATGQGVTVLPNEIEVDKSDERNDQ